MSIRFLTSCRFARVFLWDAATGPRNGMRTGVRPAANGRYEKNRQVGSSIRKKGGSGEVEPPFQRKFRDRELVLSYGIASSDTNRIGRNGGGMALIANNLIRPDSVRISATTG